MRRVLPVLIAALLALAPWPVLAGRAVFEDSGWPGELANVPVSKGKPVPYRRKPLHSAAIAGYATLPYGSKLGRGEADPAVLYRCLRPKLYRVLRSTQLEVSAYGDASYKRSTLRLQKGDRVEQLKYTGEGGVVLRIKGKLYESAFYVETDFPKAAKEVQQERTEVWFQIGKPGERPRWILYGPNISTDQHG